MSRLGAGLGAAVGAGLGAFGGAVLGGFPTANEWRRQQGFTVTKHDEERELNNQIVGAYIGSIALAAIGASIFAGSSQPQQVTAGTAGVSGQLRFP